MSEGGWRAFRDEAKRKIEEEPELPAPVEEEEPNPELIGPPAPDEPAPAPDETPSLPPEIAAWTKGDEPLPPSLPATIPVERRANAFGHWYVLAILPVAAVASLMAVRAGVNPYALCMEWWDFAFGAVFLTACLVFLGLAIFKGPRGRWHPGAPALILAALVLPVWAVADVLFGTACREIPTDPLLVPPLPPAIEVPSVPSLWPSPVPEPRPPGL